MSTAFWCWCQLGEDEDEESAAESFLGSEAEVVSRVKSVAERRAALPGPL